MNISEDTARSIAQYTELCVELYTKGGTKPADWEHARSYAVEALKGILYDNQDRFDYAPRIEAAREAQKPGGKAAAGSQRGK